MIYKVCARKLILLRCVLNNIGKHVHILAINQFLPSPLNFSPLQNDKRIICRPEPIVSGEQKKRLASHANNSLENVL